MLSMSADLYRLHTKKVPSMAKDTQQAVGLQAGVDVLEHDTSECLGLTVYMQWNILKDTYNTIIPLQRKFIGSKIDLPIFTSSSQVCTLCTVGKAWSQLIHYFLFITIKEVN